jgi:hypothetical protein
MDDDLNEVWAGRLELRLKKDAAEYAEGYRGAFITVLVRCVNACQFVAMADEHIQREGFTIVGIEGLYPLSMGDLEINETIEDLLRRTRDYPVQWTTFRLFKDDA